MRRHLLVLAFACLCAVRAFGQASADLSATKTDSPDPVLPGGTITYTITVHNAGPNAASNVFVGDNVPANTTFVGMQQTSGPGFTFIPPPPGPLPTDFPLAATLASFPAGATATFTFSVRVDEEVLANTFITNTVTVSSPTPDPNPANNSDVETTAVLGGIPVPTLSQWMLMLMAVLLAVVAVRR